VAFCQHALEMTGLAGDPASQIHRLDPRAKVLGFLAITLVAVSAPLELWPVHAACMAILAGIVATARVAPRTVWRRARPVLGLVLLVALLVPFVRHGGAAYALGPLTVHEAGLIVLGTVTVKAMIGTLSAILLGATTAFPAVLGALEGLRVPRLLVLIAALMYRYLFVIVEEVGRMRAGLAARGYRPRTGLGAGALGRLAAALFLRTYGRGERVHRAMLARGYDGTMPAATPLAFGRLDAAFVGAVIALLVPLRVAATLL